MSLETELSKLSDAIEKAIKEASRGGPKADAFKRKLFEEPRATLNRFLEETSQLSPNIFVSVKECYESFAIRSDNRGGVVLEIRYPKNDSRWFRDFGEALAPSHLGLLSHRIECSGLDGPGPRSNRLKECDEQYDPRR